MLETQISRDTMVLVSDFKGIVEDPSDSILCMGKAISASGLQAKYKGSNRLVYYFCQNLFFKLDVALQKDSFNLHAPELSELLKKLDLSGIPVDKGDKIV